MPIFGRRSLGSRHYDPYDPDSYGYGDPLVAAEERILTDELVEQVDPGSPLAEMAEIDEDFAEADLFMDFFQVNSWFHAKSAAHKWGGLPEDYIEIEEFIDSSKKIIGDHRHRSLYHHTEGVWLCQRIFGRTINVLNREIPVRLIAEQHIIEDLGWLPSPSDYIKNMEIAPWMGGKLHKVVSMSDLGLNLEEN